ncbi:MAG: hypothetical protein E7813_16905 [Bradyrhizobium sp.]|uniref:hypothetical protein n=1 Tax=Bradyrhizobium sp. TaxID=376 RepID=UPI00120F01EA|nr:hypothetical protein [Bradyrhizobium sp.]THD64226.1 MAG: hypothetical protein E7813_16905 [Bradyrhizobium sp.]
MAEIVLFGETRPDDCYGSDYLSELRRILLRYVKPRTRAYLEWGVGLSTMAILQWRKELSLDRFFSLDDNKPYMAELLPQLPDWSGFRPFTIDLRGTAESDRDAGLNYSTLPLSFGTKFDFIFIDGRRRMECAFVASLLCHRHTIVVLHDYRRTRYQPILTLFKIVEDGPQFRVMRLRNNLLIPNRLRNLPRRLMDPAA